MHMAGSCIIHHLSYQHHLCIWREAVSSITLVTSITYAYGGKLYHPSPQLLASLMHMAGSCIIHHLSYQHHLCIWREAVSSITLVTSITYAYGGKLYHPSPQLLASLMHMAGSCIIHHLSYQHHLCIWREAVSSITLVTSITYAYGGKLYHPSPQLLASLMHMAGSCIIHHLSYQHHLCIWWEAVSSITLVTSITYAYGGKLYHPSPQLLASLMHMAGSCIIHHLSYQHHLCIWREAVSSITLFLYMTLCHQQRICYKRLFLLLKDCCLPSCNIYILLLLQQNGTNQKNMAVTWWQVPIYQHNAQLSLFLYIDSWW